MFHLIITQRVLLTRTEVSSVGLLKPCACFPSLFRKPVEIAAKLFIISHIPEPAIEGNGFNQLKIKWPFQLDGFPPYNHGSKQAPGRLSCVGRQARPLSVRVYLGLALRGEVLLDKQGPESHSEVLVGLSQAQPAQVQLLLCAVDLPGKLVDGASESRGQVFAERRHDAPQHVVMEDPEKTVPYSLNLSAFNRSRIILKALFLPLCCMKKANNLVVQH